MFCLLFFQPYTDEIFYYYMIEIGFYLSLLISLFVDVKRKVCILCHFIILNMNTSCGDHGLLPLLNQKCKK